MKKDSILKSCQIELVETGLNENNRLLQAQTDSTQDFANKTVIEDFKPVKFPY
jgi:hypothetical protein